MKRELTSQELLERYISSVKMGLPKRGHGLQDSRVRGLCPRPSVSPSSVPAWVDTCEKLSRPESA